MTIRKTATKTKKSAPKKAKAVVFKTIDTPKLVNRWAIVLDESGSMGVIKGSVIGAFNQNVTDIREAAQKDNQDSSVTLITFSGGGNGHWSPKKITTVFVNQEVASLKPLTYGDFNPAGGTPLLDAVGEAVETLQRLPNADAGNVSNVVMIMTDGDENTSTKWNGTGAIANLLREKQATDRWTFAFLVPKGEGVKFATKYGIPPGNVQEWEATAAGTQQVANTVTTAVQNYSTMRSAGFTSTKALFNVDAAQIKKSELKKDLVDLSKLVKEFTVDKDGENIETFVKRKNKGAFVIGAGFYELRKKEVIQVSKQILIKDRTTGKIYGGPEARDLIKLPNYEVKVAPGTFGNYEVYVQSTSHNRKLPLSTKLLYRTDITTDLRHTWVDPTKTAVKP